jgi:hypothetical protein
MFFWSVMGALGVVFLGVNLWLDYLPWDEYEKDRRKKSRKKK